MSKNILLVLLSFFVFSLFPILISCSSADSEDTTVTDKSDDKGVVDDDAKQAEEAQKRIDELNKVKKELADTQAEQEKVAAANALLEKRKKACQDILDKKTASSADCDLDGIKNKDDKDPTDTVEDDKNKDGKHDCEDGTSDYASDTFGDLCANSTDSGVVLGKNLLYKLSGLNSCSDLETALCYDQQIPVACMPFTDGSIKLLGSIDNKASNASITMFGTEVTAAGVKQAVNDAVSIVSSDDEDTLNRCLIGWNLSDSYKANRSAHTTLSSAMGSSTMMIGGDDGFSVNVNDTSITFFATSMTISFNYNDYNGSAQTCSGKVTFKDNLVNATTITSSPYKTSEGTVEDVKNISELVIGGLDVAAKIASALSSSTSGTSDVAGKIETASKVASVVKDFGKDAADKIFATASKDEKGDHTKCEAALEVVANAYLELRAPFTAASGG